MKKVRLLYPLIVIVALGTAVELERMGVRSRWLASGFLILGVFLLVASLARLRRVTRGQGGRVLSVAAAAGLGAGFVFIAANIFWPLYRLDIVGYVLLIGSMIVASWPRAVRGRHIGA